MEVVAVKPHEYPVGTRREPGEQYTIPNAYHANVHMLLGNVRAHRYDVPARIVVHAEPSRAVSRGATLRRRKGAR
jgi:hypothetical protein